MTPHQSFMSAIIANPDDDSPRLIFADWLEEQGEKDRADFIRLQISGDDTERMESLFYSDPERTLKWFGLPMLCARVARLRRFDHDSPTYPYAIARRGFLSAVVCYWDVWRTEGDEILTSQPITSVELTDPPFWDEITQRGQPRSNGVKLYRSTLPGSWTHRKAFAALRRRWPTVRIVFPTI